VPSEGRDLASPTLFISDACAGLVDCLGEHYPASRWQRCTVHLYRNVFSVVPSDTLRKVAKMLKAIHAAEDIEAAQHKTAQVMAKLRDMKLRRPGRSRPASPRLLRLPQDS
jgi:putative transposase